MISYEYMDELLSYSRHIDMIITDGTVTVSGSSYSASGQTVLITNELLEADAFDLYQSLCSSSQLEFGACESDELKFTIYDNISTLKGKKLKVYMYINNDASTMLKLGEFKVAQDNLKGDSAQREIMAYDAIHDILDVDVTDWYNTLLPTASSTTTVAEMRMSLFSYFDIETVPTTLVNDSMTVGKTVDELTGSRALHDICEINGVFGTMTNEGKFKFFELPEGIDDGLFPADDLYPANNLYPQDVNPYVTQLPKELYFDAHFEDYNAEAITKLTIRNGGGGGASVGTDGNEYIIEDNFLLYDKTNEQITAIANNLLPKITNRYYKPCTVTCIGNPCHEVGDPIRINTVYRGVVTYILERHLTGIQALNDEYTARGVKTYSENLNSISSQVKRLNGTVTSLQVNTDSIEGRVENIESGDASIIQQLDNRISAKVSSGDVSSELSMESGQVTLSSNRLVVHSTGFDLDSDGQAIFRTLGTDCSTVLEGGEFLQSMYDDSLIVSINRGTITLLKNTGTPRYRITISTLNGSITVDELDSNNSVTHRSAVTPTQMLVNFKSVATQDDLTNLVSEERLRQAILALDSTLRELINDKAPMQTVNNMYNSLDRRISALEGN